MYRNSSWQNAKSSGKVKVKIETNKSSKSIDPYARAIKIKHKFFYSWLTVGHFGDHGNARHSTSKLLKWNLVQTLNTMRNLFLWTFARAEINT